VNSLKFAWLYLAGKYGVYGGINLRGCLAGRGGYVELENCGCFEVLVEKSLFFLSWPCSL